MTVLDAGLLATDAEEVATAIDAGRVLVAADEGSITGALLLDDRVPTDGARIEAVAVRPGRRGQGIGTALVEAAAERYGRLAAEFDAGVRPFWASLGFDVQRSTVPGRYVGLLKATADGR